MISVDEAIERVLKTARLMPAEWVLLNDGLFRVLAEAVNARRDQPPEAVSAMDGYAVRAGDVQAGAVLRRIEEIPAGYLPQKTVGAGECARIFTGAYIPAGADAILIQENTRPNGDLIEVTETVEPEQFIRPKGLDFKKNAIGLEAGRKLDPRALGLAAAMGHVWLKVRRRPRVGVLATGDELQRPGDSIRPECIVSSNSIALMAMCRAWGAEPVDLGIAKDTADDLIDAFGSATGLDLIVTSGGASVGDYDLIRPVLEPEGLEVGFWKIAMRPGKPLIFGRFRNTPFLGLPGNPVSASVCAIMFLRPLILTMLGSGAELPIRRGKLKEKLGSNDQRQDYLRAVIENGPSNPSAGDLPVLRTANRQDSSMFSVFADADALIVRPPFDPARDAGYIIDFNPLKDIFNSQD